MKLGPRSTLADVAMAVGDALRRFEIRAVLSGGACASLHSGGAYLSQDADFVIVGPCAVPALDEAMASVGFRREQSRYVRAGIPFFVEFPAGPLGIGQDFQITPVWRSERGAKMLTLSATDSCRDRLAAFYHWKDRQALAAAVAIALRHRVRMSRIEEWSRAEDSAAAFEQFRYELRRARVDASAARKRKRPRPGK